MIHGSYSSINRVRQLYDELVENKYCAVLDFGLPSQRGGRVPYVFTLRSKGVATLKEQGVDINRRARPSEQKMKTFFPIQHTLSVNEPLISLLLLERKYTFLTINQLLHEMDLKHKPVPIVDATGKSSAVYFDAWTDLSLHNLGSLPLAWESDRDTEEQRPWREKVRDRVIAFTSGAYSQTFQRRTLTILVLTTGGEKRRSELIRWTEAELESLGQTDKRELFLFSCAKAAEVSPEELFFAPVWYQPFAIAPIQLINPDYAPSAYRQGDNHAQPTIYT
jgi:hypothetical protein